MHSFRGLFSPQRALRFWCSGLVSLCWKTVCLRKPVAAAELAGKLDLLLFHRYGKIQVLAEVLHNRQKYGRARPQETYLESPDHV
jgi:hypothetical protein